VQTDVNRVLWAEEIPQNVSVSGHVYDVDTGLVTTIVDAKDRKEGADSRRVRSKAADTARHPA
jgi:carbonic anhydrase